MTQKQPFAHFRKEAGMTIDQAAKEFRVDRTTIMRWEDGSTRFPLKRRADAESILGASVRDLRPDIFAEAAE
jgi:DNA-binding XRE family transcriptional regulator